MESNFLGVFNKEKKYYAWDKNKKYETPYANEIFVEEIYRQVTKEIPSVLGHKEKYNMEEIVRYFRKKYQAYQIPFETRRAYVDTFNYIKDYISDYTDDINIPFDYQKEKNVTLVIDTVWNTALREKYPNIVKTDEKLIEEMDKNPNFYCRHENTIFVLGTVDGEHLNSIYNWAGEWMIPELNYEFYYFFNHS